ncbi:MAG TPA: TetR family transcriptional regulator [Terriglobales bacterium]|nr:TetR family transcriptional regulator [Terriglobales bacterium]
MADKGSQLDFSAVISAARTQVAEEGLRGLSMRKVAARAGNSRGGVTSQAGDKAGLLAGLLADALEFQRRKHKRWLDLTSSLDTSSPEVIAAVVRSFLNEAVTQERSHSLVLCELVAASARRKIHHDDLAILVEEEEMFWCRLQGDAPNTAILGWAIANYCRDELPFALALQGQAEYHLLRSATISRLVQRFAPMGEQGFAVGFERFVTRDESSITNDDSDLNPGKRRSHELGQAIAGLIQREGIDGVTHRSVAASAGVANSSVAHHYRTREDLLKGGLVEIYRQLIKADHMLGRPLDVVPDMTLSIASHSIAIEATRDVSLVPFALNLRKMRGEFILQELASLLGPARSDLAALQAMGMIIVGAGLSLHLAGGEILLPMRLLERLISNS